MLFRSASHILAQPFILPKDQALKLTKERNEPYKVELIQDLPVDVPISFYQHRL